MFTPRLFKIKRHSRRVLVFKRSLPVFAFVLASLMLVWPVLIAEQKEQFSVAVKTDRKNTSAKVDMEQVRFYAQDKKKQPLTVTAPKVLETDPDNQIITLYKPVATYEMENGVKLTSKTSQGLIYQQKEEMFFEDEVITTTDTGYKAVSTEVYCDNKEGNIYSKTPVTITGPAGQLKAVGFKIYNKGNNIDFFGKTDTTMNSEKGKMRVKSSDGLKIDQIPQTITAIKDVTVLQDGKTITADKMVLDYYTKKQNKNESIRQIEAFGHVVAKNDIQKITGDHGLYDPKKGTIVMDGHVVLHQGDSHMNGETATINMNTGEGTLTPKKGQKATRIRGRLIPQDFKGDKK